MDIIDVALDKALDYIIKDTSVNKDLLIKDGTLTSLGAYMLIVLALGISNSLWFGSLKK